MTTSAVIVAAGRGSRAAADGGAPKQYVRLGGRVMLAHTVATFLGHPQIARVVVVVHREDRDAYDAAVAEFAAEARLLPPVIGGATRQESVRAGLVSLEGTDTGSVLIHDAARPFAGADVIDRVIGGLSRFAGAIAAVPVADTLKRQGDDAGRPVIAATVPRAGLWRAQTPQGFDFAAILEAHGKAAAAGLADFTDDAAIAEWAGLCVGLVAGSERNSKITTAEDIALARRRFDEEKRFDKEKAEMAAGPAATGRELTGREAKEWETRTGTGFDVHRFAEGNSVWLCGVEIPHERRLDGHSDADVGLHALTDAILGAIGDGDIGEHFPPSDPQWKGAASDRFLADAGHRVRNRGGRIVNVDVTLLCEAPKIGPHRAAMRTRIADILGIAVERVGVKATTTERLGFTGRKEGIAAMASASVLLPVEDRTRGG